MVRTPTNVDETTVKTVASGPPAVQQVGLVLLYQTFAEPSCSPLVYFGTISAWPHAKHVAPGSVCRVVVNGASHLLTTVRRIEPGL